MQLVTSPTLLIGKIIHGNKVGRKLGFPTANLNLTSDKSESKKLLEGVYSAISWIFNRDTELVIDADIEGDNDSKTDRFVSNSYRSIKKDMLFCNLHTLLNLSDFSELSNKVDIRSIASPKVVEYNPRNLEQNDQLIKSQYSRSEEKLIPYPTLLHIGPRSTFSDFERKYEAHIIGKFENLPTKKKVLYGKTLVVLPLVHQRDSVKYEGVVKLVEQMKKDKEIAKRYLLKPANSMLE